MDPYVLFEEASIVWPYFAYLHLTPKEYNKPTPVGNPDESLSTSGSKSENEIGAKVIFMMVCLVLERD